MREDREISYCIRSEIVKTLTNTAVKCCTETLFAEMESLHTF